MTNGNYVANFKVLGKLAKIYDTASASVSTLKGLLAITIDQVADGTEATLPTALLMQNHYTVINAAITNGPVAIKASAIAAASAHLTSSTFTDGLTTTPTANTAAAVLAALQTEMGAGVDNKTLTTKASTGLVNFFDTILGSSGTWNTASDGSADYKDSVYVVSSIV